MNENLMVNSKTDILEFKRKHNLLVANGTIKANVSNVKELTNDVINNLRCGDVVLKEDSSGKHAYLVSFKSDSGLCLTYCDASCVETQSYDKVGDNWVYNSQDLSFINRMEQIVDEQGHNRFVEGDITIEEISGITQTYGKWSLSGSHLLIVLGIDIANASVLTAGTLCNINLPDWIKQKIVALWGSIYIESINFNMWADDWTTQTIRINFTKTAQNDVRLAIATGITLTANRHCRIAFDLLIDND